MPIRHLQCTNEYATLVSCKNFRKRWAGKRRKEKGWEGKGREGNGGGEDHPLLFSQQIPH